MLKFHNEINTSKLKNYLLNISRPMQYNFWLKYFFMFPCVTFMEITLWSSQTLKIDIPHMYHRSICRKDKSFIYIMTFDLYRIQVIYKFSGPSCLRRIHVINDNLTNDILSASIFFLIQLLIICTIWKQMDTNKHGQNMIKR